MTREQAIKKEIDNIAQENGFDKGVYRCKWKIFDVYDVAFNNAKESACVGQPILILVYKDIVRTAMEDEIEQIFASEK